MDRSAPAAHRVTDVVDRLVDLPGEHVALPADPVGGLGEPGGGPVVSWSTCPRLSCPAASTRGNRSLHSSVELRNSLRSSRISFRISSKAWWASAAEFRSCSRWAVANSESSLAACRDSSAACRRHHSAHEPAEQAEQQRHRGDPQPHQQARRGNGGAGRRRLGHRLRRAQLGHRLVQAGQPVACGGVVRVEGQGHLVGRRGRPRRRRSPSASRPLAHRGRTPERLETVQVHPA